MRVYYAHCIAIYNTMQEQRDIELLEELRYEVVNPNSPGVQAQCDAVRANFLAGAYPNCKDDGEAVMVNVFRALVSPAKVEALAFRALPDGRIPAGVFQEIMWAQDRGLPIFELPSGVIDRNMTVSSTRNYLREIGVR